MKQIIFLILLICLVSCKSYKSLQSTQLYLELPEYCPTPDAFAIAPDGSLTLSCPNYASKEIKGILVKITKDGKVKELSKVLGSKPETFASPMGIAYAPDGTLIVCANQGANNGRVLKLTFENDELKNTEVIAYGINNPNGVKIHNGNIYVTTPVLPKYKTDKMTSGVYRFSLYDREVEVKNDSTDKNLIFTTQTNNPVRQFGLDGLTFDNKGNLLVGDFGDGIIHQLKLSDKGKVLSNGIYAALPDTSGIDGMTMDKKGNLYVVGFSQNQLWKIDAQKRILLIAEYPDNDGSNGELDQPVDVVIYNGKLVISNFDLMIDEDMVNRRHSKPYVLSVLQL